MKEITRESALEALEQIRKEEEKNGTSDMTLDSDAYEEDGKVPNAETLAAMNEYYEMKAHPEKYKRYASLKDAMNPIEYMGYQEGLEIGIQIGENNVNKSAAVKMHKKGYKPGYIAEFLEMSLEQVMEWIEER